MGENTKIEWCHSTFNPWMGCTKVAPGCTHCYAEAFTKRYGKADWGPNGTRVKTSDANWRKPLKWNEWARDGVCWVCHGKGVVKSKEHDWEPCMNCDEHGKVGPYRGRVFCASLADVFEDWNGEIHGGGKDDGVLAIDDARSRLLTMDDMRRDLFALIDATPNLDWLLLTKRPENVLRMWPVLYGNSPMKGDTPEERLLNDLVPHRPNCWLGASANDQETFETACKHLREVDTLAAHCFISLEPMTGPVHLKHWPWHDEECPSSRWLDQLIVGGESGPSSRVFRPRWMRSLLKECRQAGIAYFGKQMGANIEIENDSFSEWPREGDGLIYDDDQINWHYQGEEVRVHLHDKKGGDTSEWPESLRVREFPKQLLVQ